MEKESAQPEEAGPEKFKIFRLTVIHTYVLFSHETEISQQLG